MLLETTGRLDDPMPAIAAAMPARPAEPRRKRPAVAAGPVPLALVGRPAPTAIAHPSVSGFEQVAETVARVCASRKEMLGVLLGATLPLVCGNRPVLRPLWTNEAMHRAYCMVRLVARLERDAPLRASDRLAAGAELRLARELADTLRGLDFADDTAPLPCSGPLRTLVRDLVELFGPIAPLLRLDTAIEPLLLPAYQRRALLLAAGALVCDPLGGQGSERGCRGIAVTLRRVQPARAALRIALDGPWLSLVESARPHGVVADLASLLESEPVLVTDSRGRGSVEIAFPVPPPGLVERRKRIWSGGAATVADGARTEFV